MPQSRGGCAIYPAVRWFACAAFLYIGVVTCGAVVQAAIEASLPRVIINEIMWDGMEYIEVRNTTEELINLAGWQLKRQRPDKEVETILTFTADDAVEANGFWLLEKNEQASTVTADRLLSSLSLLNTGEQLQLVDDSGVVVDRANPVGAWLAGENTEAGVSMERRVEGIDGQIKESWQTSTGQSSGRAGTPGEPNSIGKVNISPEAVITLTPIVSTVSVGHIVDFSAEDSADPDGDSISYQWDLGDGATSSVVTVRHHYSRAGTFDVRLTVNDGNISSTASKKVTVTTPDYSDEVVINEVLPNPVGTDTASEFIELFNVGDENVDLASWQLDDAEGGSRPYVIPIGTQLLSGEYMLWQRAQTLVALNNTKDSVRLLDPTGKVKDSFTYAASSPEGQSHNRTTQGTYVLSTSLTPGTVNRLTLPASSDLPANEAEEEDVSSSRVPKVAGEKITKVALEAVRSQPIESWVETEGVVSVPWDILGKKVMYVAGSGIQVFVAGENVSLPELEIGDTVRLSGQLTSYYGEVRLTVADVGDIIVSDNDKAPEPHVVPTSDISQKTEGWLVRVTGTVVETSGDTFSLDDGSGEAKIVIKEATGIDKPAMKKGMIVNVTGVVSASRSGYRVLPRFDEDLTIGQVAGLRRFPATGSAIARVIAIPAGVISLLLFLAYKRREPLILNPNFKAQNSNQ